KRSRGMVVAARQYDVGRRAACERERKGSLIMDVPRARDGYLRNTLSHPFGTALGSLWRWQQWLHGLTLVDGCDGGNGVLRDGAAIGHDDVGHKCFLEAFNFALDSFQLGLDAEQERAPLLPSRLRVFSALAYWQGEVEAQPAIVCLEHDHG